MVKTTKQLNSLLRKKKMRYLPRKMAWPSSRPRKTKSFKTTLLIRWKSAPWRLEMSKVRSIFCTFQRSTKSNRSTSGWRRSTSRNFLSWAISPKGHMRRTRSKTLRILGSSPTQCCTSIQASDCLIDNEWIIYSQFIRLWSCGGLGTRQIVCDKHIWLYFIRSTFLDFHFFSDAAHEAEDRVGNCCRNAHSPETRLNADHWEFEESQEEEYSWGKSDTWEAGALTLSTIMYCSASAIIRAYRALVKGDFFMVWAT